jgi:hypothetical protein
MNTHALSGTRNHEPGIRASEDISYLIPRGHCGRLCISKEVKSSYEFVPRGPSLEKYIYSHLSLYSQNLNTSYVCQVLFKKKTKQKYIINTFVYFYFLRGSARNGLYIYRHKIKICVKKKIMSLRIFRPYIAESDTIFPVQYQFYWHMPWFSYISTEQNREDWSQVNVQARQFLTVRYYKYLHEIMSQTNSMIKMRPK